MQQQFSCLFTIFFGTIPDVATGDHSELEKLKIEIGKRLKQIREGQHKTQDDVASRLLSAAGTPKHRSVSSRFEGGQFGTEIDGLLKYITEALHVEFGEFCSYFTTDDAERRSEELEARDMLEALLREGPRTRSIVLKSLKEISAPKAAHADKSSSRTNQQPPAGRGSRA